MKAAIFLQTGGPDVLRVAEVERPTPGPGQVLLRVTSAGLNRADALFRAGQYFVRPRLPSRIGLEAAGVVEAAGEGSRFAPGDRVATLPGMLDPSAHGGVAEFTLADDAILIRSPDSIDPRDAGGVWMPYLTAWGALRHAVNIGPGQFVVITAASSSVGLAAVQVARRFGAIAIATTTSAHKIDRLKQNGADHVIDMKSENYVPRMKQITGGAGADVVFDAVAGPGVAAHLRACRAGGTIFLYGALDPAPTDLQPAHLIGKNLTLRGYTLFPLIQDRPALDAAVGEITQALNAGEFTLPIDRRFPMAEIQQAHRYLESNAQIGKIVINP